METVIQFHENTLPDTRVEKYSLLLNKTGNYKIHYVGGPATGNLYTGLEPNQLFNKLHILPTDNKIRLGLPYFFKKYRKNFEKIYNEIKPDIVHAHNVFAGKVCYDLGIDFIYDDHEFWYYHGVSRKNRPKGLLSKNRITDNWIDRTVKKWEKQVVRRANIVVGINEFHVQDLIKFYGSGDDEKFVTVPNFPTQHEIDNFPLLDQIKPTDDLYSILVSKPGGYFHNQSTKRIFSTFVQNKLNLTLIGKSDYTQVPEEVNHKGFLPHNEFLKQLSQHHIGLIQFTKDTFPEFYPYASANRMFYYAHYGVLPILKKEMTYLTGLFGESFYEVRNEEEIGPLLVEIKQDLDAVIEKSNLIKEYAKKNIIFDKSFDDITKFYNKMAEI